MKIGILSFRPTSKQTSVEERRLRQAALALGYKVQIFRSKKCQQIYDDKKGSVLYDGKKFPKIDVLIPRPSLLREVDVRLSVLKQFHIMGMPTLNKYVPVLRAKNKLRAQQILHSQGIPSPHTFVLEDLKYLDKAVDYLGGMPLIVKDPFGSFGSGVVIVESKRAAKSVIGAMWKDTPKILMLQEYIAESEGRDTRVFVVDGKVVAAMERSAQAEEFRSNVELGGVTEAVEVSKEYAELAIKSAKVLDLDVAGVDIIETKRGPAVLEVNANPGFKALEKITGIDVATPIIECAVKRARFNA